jgi:CheY-like chemotaxis protein
MLKLGSQRTFSVMSQTKPKLRPARKVLVIDDEEAFCVLLARMIGHMGYKVTTSSQAKSAHLEEMTESDIIFIDMMMPGMNGLQVLDLLSNHQIKSPGDLRAPQRKCGRTRPCFRRPAV